MTDEEKNAIDDLKEVVDLYNDKCLITTEDDFKSIEILLNLIEKQSNEIEELIKERAKEIVYVDRNFIKKDKIKAKIEQKLKELDKQINEEWKKYGNSKELQDMEDMYNFLQSLLEKE